MNRTASAGKSRKKDKTSLFAYPLSVKPPDQACAA
jgi:hypothetical protein